MFNSRTLFIVGAGASKEAGLPIGEELTDRIAGLLKLNVDYRTLKSGDDRIYFSLQRLVDSDSTWRENNFIASARAVAEAMDLALSIDTFLETHASNHEFIMLGKMGIVRAIAIEEKRSLLAPTDESRKPFNMRQMRPTWYYSLARQLFTGVPVERPEDAFSDVAFIVFNYDRCLQVFLQRALEVYFRLSAPRAEQIVKSVRIIHPYGSLGSIFQGDNGYIPFAYEDFNLIDAAGRIRTFSESIDSEATSQMRRLVDDAETLIFLGFGFHEQNMRLLDPDHAWLENEAMRHRAFATACGLSESDTKVIRDQISYLRTGGPEGPHGHWISTLNGTCADLFRSYWRSLTG